jgi:hypothetical protein
MTNKQDTDGTIPSVGGKVECNRETLLSCGKILAVELVALLDSAEASVLTARELNDTQTHIK